MACILTLTANPLVDCLASGPARLGAVNRFERFDPVAGGKGLNAGRVLAAFGHRVLAAGFAGGWSGRVLEQLVAGDGMDPLLVETEARTRIGFNIVGPEGCTACLENGFAVRPVEIERLLETVRSRLAQVELVMISGSVPDPACVDLYARVAEACAAVGVPCWLDAYGMALERALAGDAPLALVKVNRQEIREGKGLDAWQELHVTDGPQGVQVRSRRGSFLVRPPALKERSAIGSGDCYFAVLAHARLSGMPEEEQLRWAAAAGAANAALGTTARIRPEDVEPWVGAVEVVAISGKWRDPMSRDR